jgi:PEGA domain
MTRRTLIAVSAAIVLAQVPAFARPKRKEYNASATQVFDAAVKTAKEEYAVTSSDDKLLKLTFVTGRTSFRNGFTVNASVEAESGGETALALDVQQQPGDGFAFNAGARLAEKFYADVAAKLAGDSPVKAAVKPEAPPVKTLAPPPPVAATITATADYGMVAVTCSIESADVTVDGSFVGNLPTSLRLPPGKHTVQVSLAGYKAWSREITVMAGADLRLIATLTKE